MSNGVVVTKVDPDSDAADKGLEPGDVVVSVGNKPVHTPAGRRRPASPTAKQRGRKTRAAAGHRHRAASASSPSRSGRRDSYRTARAHLRALRPPRWRRRPHPPVAAAGADPIRIQSSRGDLGMRILVVEDDLEAQRYLVKGLKEAGHVVDDAADGDTGPDAGAVAAL